MKKIIALLLSLAIIVSIVPTYAEDAPLPSVDEMISSLSEGYSGTIDDWAAMSLMNLKNVLGQDIDFDSDEYAYIAQNNLENSNLSTISYAKAAITLSSLNINADEEVARIINNPSLQSIYDLAYTLLAVDGGNYTLPDGAVWTREALVQKILELQEQGGGWTWDIGKGMDVDTTAMVIPALAPYKDDPNVALALDTAVQLLAENQAEDGGYIAWGSKSSNSLSVAIIALCSLGIDPNTDVRFIKNGKGLIDTLLTYATTEKRFGNEDGSTYNEFSTEQGFMALVAYKMFLQGNYGFYRFAVPQNSKPKLPDTKNLISSLALGYKDTTDDWAAISLMNIKNVVKQSIDFDSGAYVNTALDNLEKSNKAAISYAKAAITLSSLNIKADEEVVQLANNSTLQSIYDLAYTLLAVDSGNYTLPVDAVLTREALVQKILELKEQGGGWTWDIGKGMDVDTTAMVITALAPYKDSPDVALALDIAVQLLADKQAEDGGYIAWEDNKSSNTLSVVIIALCSLGIDPNTDVRFIKNGKGLIDTLLTYVTAENKFGNEDNSTYNELSTEQGFMALVSYKMFLQRNYNFYQFGEPQNTKPAPIASPLPSPTPTASPVIDDGTSSGGSRDKQVTLMVQDLDGKTMFKRTTVTVGKNDSVARILINTLGTDRVASRGSGTSIYISGIDDLNEFDYGATSGWVYEINGEELFKSSGSFIPKDGDDILWKYTLGDDEAVTGGGGGGGSSSSNKDASANLLKLVSLFEKQTDITPDEGYAIAKNGKTIPKSAIDSAIEYLKEEDGDFTKVTDYCKLVLLLKSAGKSVTEVEGYNLLEKIYNNEKLTIQGSNGVIYSLIVLNDEENIPSDAKWTTDKLLAELLTYQNSDGGFPLAKGDKSNIDLTAMALNALAPYKEWKTVKPVVDNALKYIDSSRNTDGTFSLDGVENCESVAQVIIGSASLGLDTEKYIGALNKFKLANGYYSHTIGGSMDEMSSEQAAMALTANTKGPIFNITPKAEPKENILAKPDYSDLSDASDWAIDSIKMAQTLGLVNGSGDNKFMPQNDITRAEIVAMILRLKGIKPTSNFSNTYSDVSENDWFWGYVLKANELGIVTGFDGKFMPNEVISRQDMAVIIARAFDLTSENSADIKDIDSADDYAISSINSVFSKGIMLGSDGNFEPKINVKREMAATIIVRLYDK